jgi:hypothetical protein
VKRTARLGPGVCPKVVAKGFRCIMSNQGVWYLDHLDVPWEDVYSGEPLAGISDREQQKLVLGGEVCMWGETADTSDVLQTIWPRAAAAAGTTTSHHTLPQPSSLSTKTHPHPVAAAAGWLLHCRASVEPAGGHIRPGRRDDRAVTATPLQVPAEPPWGRRGSCHELLRSEAAGRPGFVLRSVSKQPSRKVTYPRPRGALPSYTSIHLPLL